MRVYEANKKQFVNDVVSNTIEEKIFKAVFNKLGRRSPEKEVLSWQNSMLYMRNVIGDEDIPNDAGIAIEFQIPQSSKRVDFIISGSDEKNGENLILIELKQWSEAELTDKDAIVKTFIGRGKHELLHPSYQAWSYASLLEGFNQTVYEEGINVLPCAYLHNYRPDNIINNDFYTPYIEKAPLFLRNDINKLRDFIKRYIKKGDNGQILYKVDNGKIKPSKNLADNLSSMLNGNAEFIMIDEQKMVFENAMQLSRKASTDKKQVFIIDGGPGTGKSVVAINLLVEITKKGLLTQYVTKNAAPRAVYEKKLTGSFRKSHISNMFKGSGSYINARENEFDVLIVDEAHRLNERSGLFKNLGENQIKELIRCSKCVIFFIDEDQRVTLDDIGSKIEIIRWAKHFDAEIEEATLSSQFRCNGSDGYLAWLDNVLDIKETANKSLDGIDYDFQVYSSPKAMQEKIVEKNSINNKARLVAGYCWDWVSKKKDEYDVVLKDHDFAIKWNLQSDGNLWIMNPSAINEIGCIHTCQGLELDFIGVIIGPDLYYHDGRIQTDGLRRARTDNSLKGFKTMLKSNPKEAKEKADLIIKNTYRTLMTRGMKGCYVYCVDDELNEYLKRFVK